MRYLSLALTGWHLSGQQNDREKATQILDFIIQKKKKIEKDQYLANERKKLAEQQMLMEFL